MKGHKKEAFLFVVALIIAVIGLSQLFHDVAFSCNDWCSSVYCECYWNGGGDMPHNGCVSLNGYSCHLYPDCSGDHDCDVWCGQWNSEASCEGGVY
jgi:hypothetical protein